MVQFLDVKKHEIRKSSSICIHLPSMRELQRCTSFTVIARYISSRVTGVKEFKCVRVPFVSTISSSLILMLSAQMHVLIAQLRLLGKVTEEDKRFLVEKVRV